MVELIHRNHTLGEGKRIWLHDYRIQQWVEYFKTQPHERKTVHLCSALVWDRKP